MGRERSGRCAGYAALSARVDPRDGRFVVPCAPTIQRTLGAELLTMPLTCSRSFVGAERDDDLVKQRYIRSAAALSDDDLLVRGGDLAAAVIRADARRNHSIYGTYGVSVFATREATIDELAQRSPLVRFARLTLMTVDALRAVGMRLQPTGHNPAHYDIEFDALEPGVSALYSCQHCVVINPYHDR